MKVKQVGKFLFDRQISLVWQMYLWTAIVVLALPAFLALVTGTIQDFSFSDQLTGTPIGLLVSGFVFVISMLTYTNFKLLIQNGISRMTFFKGQVISLALVTLIANTINMLFGWLTLPISDSDNFNIFSAMYQHTFSNQIVSGAINFVFSWLLLLAISLTGLAIGSLMSLFSKRVQRLIFIAVPVVLFVILIFSINTFKPSEQTASWVEDFVKYILGYTDSEGTVLVPWRLMVSMIIWSGIMTWFSKEMFARKQLKRE
ncbi:ABC transporter permease [Lentilactobacillus kosonis]|uniref:ABC transporter, permease protein n=1 Tax=Lentilactobacillus kosonis TaxID=2810561 RepID=A0A401FIB3_9LACO|nr:ABC transporter permease [Lentilactobacillus kosonis]GAY72092.1 ABC transporter, permease protein [Lentilactobacillus kosonis]